MVRVDFYVLEGKGSHLREQYACRVTEKAYKLGHRVYIHTSDEQQASAVDDMLWTFSQGSFIPHARLKENATPHTPVHIGQMGGTHSEADVLINLSPEVPPFYDQYERVVEIIDQNDAIKTKGRERFMFYRKQDCDINSHNVNG